MAGDAYAFLAKVGRVTRPTNIRIDLLKLLKGNTPAGAIGGVLSEFYAFLYAVKKKMLAIDPSGAARRDRPAQLTSSQKTQVFEAYPELRSVGLEIFGFH